MGSGLFLEGEHKKIQSSGAIAFIVVERDEKGKPSKVHFGRNRERPLKFLLSKTHLLISSEADCDDIAEDVLYTYTYKNNEVTTQDLEFPTYVYAYSRPADSHYSKADSAFIPPDDINDVKRSEERQITPANFGVLRAWGNTNHGLGGYDKDDIRIYRLDSRSVTKQTYLEAFADHVVKWLTKICNDPHEAIEVAETIFTKVLNIQEKLEEEDYLLTWEKLDLQEADELASALGMAQRILKEDIKSLETT